MASAGILETTLYIIKGIAILDNDGNRIFAKYYDPNILSTTKEQKAFEKNLFNKTHRANGEIILLDGLVCVYRSNIDLYFYVMGSSNENELIFVSVLNCLYDSISQILRKNVEKKVVLDNLDIVMLAIDEICDGGIILEADSGSVVHKVALRADDLPLGEQTVAQKKFSCVKSAYDLNIGVIAPLKVKSAVLFCHVEYVYSMFYDLGTTFETIEKYDGFPISERSD